MKPSRTSAVRSGKNSVSMKVNMGAIDAMLAGLEGDIQKAVRPASQAAADVIYKAVLKNVDAIGSKTGNLRGSIYQVFSESNSVEGQNGGYKRATYHVSWNAKDAPHAQLIEYGHIQRYAVNLSKDGHWYTVVRADKRGTPKPKRRASQAEKDAYYVLRPGGPVQHPARPFIRPAFDRQGDAAEAAKTKLLDVLGAK
jgi:hypothetical protein